MQGKLDELLGKVTEMLKSEARTETIIGEEFKLGEFTCVPVIKVVMGFGTGGGGGEDKTRGKGEGSGIGAGMNIVPVGFLITRGEQISFIGTEKSKGLDKIFDKAPDLIEGFMKNRSKEDNGKKEPA
jgi:uncharacterized spore protein YtfJ